ncbi:MAG: hypothetical protein LPK02_07675 [Rhodobacterales bacterium]|nr:hypothetical protein [Rhodobacterales bacterium]
MQIFVPGSNVTVVFDLIDPETSEMISPASAAYQVFDDEGVQVVPTTPVALTGDEESIEITVVAADNTVTGSNGARTVVLTLQSAGKSFQLSQTYVLENFGFLSVPSQSAMTLPQAMILARSMSTAVMEAWEFADDRERQGALQDAWSRLCRLPYLPWRDYEERPGSGADRLIKGEFRLDDLTNDEWALLPDHFKKALKRAQLIEAAVVLGGDPSWDRRQDGLISKTVGESSEMFMTRKPGMTTISPKAHEELRGYIRRSIRIGRA